MGEILWLTRQWGAPFHRNRMREAPRTNESYAIEDRRQAERYPIALTISLPPADGITHNVSESGVLFESDVAVAVDEPIDFGLIFRERRSVLRIRCSGHVVRVERRGAARLVAVHFDDYQIYN
jgi:PilZ domain